MLSIRKLPAIACSQLLALINKYFYKKSMGTRKENLFFDIRGPRVN